MHIASLLAIKVNLIAFSIRFAAWCPSPHRSTKRWPQLQPQRTQDVIVAIIALQHDAGERRRGSSARCTELPGYRIVRNLGIVRGIIVRSRSLLGSLGAGLQTILGGNITLLTQLCEKTREDAYELLLQHAAEHGANAIIAMRYDATEVMQGVSEVLAYGTAVVVERSS